MKKHKTVLITGATSGVGLEIAQQLLKQEAHIIAVGRNARKVEELIELGMEAYAVDLTNEDNRQQLIERLPIIDVAIFSAGVGTFEYADRIADEAIEQMLQVNVEVPMKMARDVLPKLSTNGHYIFIGSQAGKVATPKASVYAATKHALIGYTNALRMELKSRGVAVTVIHPGPIDTPFIDHADQTNMYRKSMARMLLSPRKVAEKTIRTIYTRQREVNIPWYMGISSKFYALSPRLTEILGKSFFNKK